MLPGVRISVVVRWTTRIDTFVSASLVETFLIDRTLHVLLYALINIYTQTTPLQKDALFVSLRVEHVQRKADCRLFCSTLWARKK